VILYLFFLRAPSAPLWLILKFVFYRTLDCFNSFGIVSSLYVFFRRNDYIFNQEWNDLKLFLKSIVLSEHTFLTRELEKRGCNLLNEDIIYWLFLKNIINAVIKYPGF